VAKKNSEAILKIMALKLLDIVWLSLKLLENSNMHASPVTL